MDSMTATNRPMCHHVFRFLNKHVIILKRLQLSKDGSAFSKGLDQLSQASQNASYRDENMVLEELDLCTLLPGE